MAKEKASFKEFLSSIAPEHQAFVEKLNNKLIEQGCNLVIKEAKSGCTASYQLALVYELLKTKSGKPLSMRLPRLL